MKQVIQDVRSGATTVRDLPAPIALPHHVVVNTLASVVSAGTERTVVNLARKSLLGKARERPDHVRRVLEKVRQEGLFTTARQVFAKLDEPMPLGYSAAGVVLECGRGVQEFKPGDRVAVAGPHAGVIVIGKNLCALVPDGVSFEQAAYTPIGAIALEGVRLARPQLGDRVLVIGLGLVGLMTVALLKAHGCRVLGVDLDARKTRLAEQFGADETTVDASADTIARFTSGHGVDSTIITAATTSNGPIELAARACRQRGRIVLVGVAGLDIPRPPFFEKELEFTVSSSLGPGRMDPVYEERGVDYPIGHARWTAQRNMVAVLETIAAKKLPVEKLTTHRFSIERAAEAYDLITVGTDLTLGVVIEYPEDAAPNRRIELRATAAPRPSFGVSLIGVGNFARLFLLPMLGREKNVSLRAICSAHGAHAQHSGKKYDFAFATTEAAAVLADPDTHVVFIATRHDLHAELVIAALRAGKHVFVEKPLCVSEEQLSAIEAVLSELGDRAPLLAVGYNRRFAPAIATVAGHFAGVEPLTVSYRFATGALPASAWPQDEEIGGGRIVGEVCHLVDLCGLLTGSQPRRVYAESLAKKGALATTDDHAAITLRHANGSLSNLVYEAGGDRGAGAERIEVFGGGRTAVVDDWGTVELWADGKCKRVRGGKDKGHASEISRFLDACRTGGPWPIAWSDLRATSWATFAAVRSLREGVAIESEGG